MTAPTLQLFPDWHDPRHARVGHFWLIRQIGAGGMGSVYLAWPDGPRPDARVAVKIVGPTIDREWAQERLRHEREVLSRLSHTNIARLLGGGTSFDGSPYLVTEYVDGPTIDRYCTGRRLETSERLRLLLGVCDAVAYAHRRGIVHCDLKPSNILVAADGTPKLLDFGIARFLGSRARPEDDEPATLPHVMTPQYASPEQLRGEAATPASDVYSLGVVMHELLTGRLPSRAAKAARLLPAALESIIGKSLSQAVEDRYSSVADLAHDIGRYLTGEAVLARPNTVGRRAAQFIRRQHAPFFSTLLATITRRMVPQDPRRASRTGPVLLTWRALTMKRLGAGPT